MSFQPTAVDLMQRFADPRHIVVVAHRGFSSRYPENTMLAFRKAVEWGADLIELDLRSSREGIPIVLHDATLDRTTDATGAPDEYSLHQLRQVNASHWRGSPSGGCRSAEPACARAPVPSLEEVLDGLAHCAGFNLHLHEARPDFLREVCRLCNEFDLYDQVYVTVADERRAQAVRALDPELPLCILEGRDQLDRDALTARREAGSRYLQLTREQATPELAILAIELGFAVCVLGAETPDEIVDVVRRGYRGLVTSAPDLALQTLEQLGFH